MIAAINGHAIAGGMELVMGTDIRVAVPGAKFGLQEVVPPEQLMDRCLEIAGKIVANGPVAVSRIRRSVIECDGHPEAEALALEKVHAQAVVATEDAVEGPRAFMEKRKPVFKGR